MKSFKVVVCASILVSVFFIPAVSVAEEDVAAIEEVVVTGLRRSETVLETPASITALGMEELQDKGIVDIRDIQYLVPSLQFGEFLGLRQVSIRGIGQFQDAPGVMVSADGVIQSVGSSAGLSQLDLERVEVLRGPQGTLYGRNSTGGAVNYISAKPTDEFEGYVRAGFAEFDHATIEGVISGPLGDSARFRLAANHLDAGEGWIENLQPGEPDLMQGEKSNLRLTIEADLTDDLSATLSHGRSQQDGIWDHHAMALSHVDLGISSGLAALDPRTDPPSAPLFTTEPWKMYSRGPVATDRKYESTSLTLEWDVGDISVKSITAQQDFDNYFYMSADATSIGLFQRRADQKTETFTQEITVSGTSGDVEWVAGAYYMDDERANFAFFDFPIPALFPLPVPIQLDFKEPYYDTESRSAFLDFTWAVSDRVRLGAGMRRTEEEKREGHSFTILAQFPDGPVPIAEVCGPGLFEQEFDESENTIRASVEYDLNDTSMAYVSYSEGFKVGGVNGSDCNPPWNPETVDAYEVGYKASFGDGSSNLRMALFHYDYSDFQLLQVIGIQGVITNAGDAEIDGLELEYTNSLNENWSLNAAVTLLDHQYGTFLNTDTLNLGLGVQDNKGNPLSYAPDTSTNLGISYNTLLSGGSSLSASLDASYRSRVYYREFDNKDDSTDPYTIMNLNVNWNSTDDMWGVRLFVRNLTDEDYITNLQGSNTTYGRQGSWNMPRQAGFEVTRFFGAR